MWLGSTPNVYYTEKRVHPQVGYDRPGWLRCEQFGAGMITGWGAHHLDSAHWGMDTERTGPVEIWGTAEFPTKGLWDVHGPFETHARYANGVEMIVSGEFPNGIRFEGSQGWIFVSRGNERVTGSDPVAKLKDDTALAASDPKIITSVIGPNETQPLQEHRPPRQLARVREVAQGDDRSGGSGAPCLLGVPAPPHRDEDEAQAVLGSGAGALQERRRRQRDAVAAAAQAVRDRLARRRGSSQVIHVIAVLTAKPGKRDAMLEAFRANVPNVLAEPGCIEYGAAVDVEPGLSWQAKYGPDAFVVVEKWADLAALQAHAVAPHMKAYGKQIAELVAERAVYVLAPT